MPSKAETRTKWINAFPESIKPLAPQAILPGCRFPRYYQSERPGLTLFANDIPKVYLRVCIEE